MDSEDRNNDLYREIMSMLNSLKINKETESKKGCGISTSNLLVIAGLLFGSLKVVSLLIDMDQNVQIVVSGSFKKEKKNQLEEIMDKLGTLPFDEVIKAVVNRFR